MTKTGGEWSDNELDLLHKMTDDGRSASEISIALGTRSRNSVVSKWHRSEWYSPKTDIHQARKPAEKPRVSKPKAKRPSGVRNEEQRQERMILVADNLSKMDDTPTADEVASAKFLLDLELDEECRWVIMSSIGPTSALYCARPRSPDHTLYCEVHAQRGTVKVQPVRRSR